MIESKILDTKRLDELSNILSIKAVCEAGGLNYFTIIRKIYRFRSNPSNGKLRQSEVEALINGLKKYNVHV